MFLLKIILQYVPEGFKSWKYNQYFPVPKGEGKIPFKAKINVLEIVLFSWLCHPHLVSPNGSIANSWFLSVFDAAYFVKKKNKNKKKTFKKTL